MLKVPYSSVIGVIIGYLIADCIWLYVNFTEKQIHEFSTNIITLPLVAIMLYIFSERD